MTAANASPAAELGTVDLLLGLLAEIALREGRESGEPRARIAVGEFMNGLHALQRRAEFKEDLQYLDFDQLGGSSYSEFLEAFLFLGGAWRQHRVANTPAASISVDHKQAARRLAAIEAQHGADGLSKVKRLASAFRQLRQAAYPRKAEP